jgi:hypothetical protein
MKAIALLALAFALAGTAAAQAPAPEQPKTTPKPPALNLRLDDAAAGAPRITFGSAPSAQTKDEREKGLPELGGKSQLNFDRPINPESRGSPIPKDSNPGL